MVPDTMVHCMVVKSVPSILTQIPMTVMRDLGTEVTDLPDTV
jgi:hypothetical protein